MAEKLVVGILNTSIIVGLSIIVSVVVLSLCRKKYSAKSRKAIWILTALCLLIPFYGISLPYAYTIEIPNIVIKEFNDNAADSIPSAHNGESIQSQTDTSNLTPNTSRTEITTGNVLFILWICVGIFMTVYYMAGYLRMKQKIRRWSSKCADSQVKDMLIEICAEIGLKKIPKIRIMEDLAASPFTTGVVRNIIILPDGDINKKDLKYVIKHEAVHCKNKDILWKILFLVVNIVHWFNPFVWILRKFAEQDMEIACDEEVIMKSSMETRREYSDVIMAWVGNGGYKGHVLSTGYVHGVRFLKWRFDNIFSNERKNKGIVLIGGAIVLILSFGSIINIKGGEKTYAAKKVPVDYGIEVRTDVDGDGKADRVQVVDAVSGDYAFTQVSAALNNGSDFFIDYQDSWASSYLVTGDLNGNGAADMVVIRYSTGSTYGGCAVSVLHMGKNELGEDDFEEYPSVFIQNPELGTEQPVGFGEEDWFSCIGASIIEKNGKTMLRLIACVDVMNDIAQCIDCSYRDDGWYIEDIQIVNDYWKNDKESELLGGFM